MSQLNVVMLKGRAGADIDIRPIANNGQVGVINLAVDHHYQDRNGKAHTDTDWFRIVTYNKGLIAKLADKASKGRSLFIHGTLRPQSWLKDGVKQYGLDVLVDHAGTISPVADDSAPVNTVLLAGRLGGNADIKTLPGAKAGKVARMSIGASRSFVTRDGEWKEETDWLRVFTFQPSLVDKVLSKHGVTGRLLMVRGALRAKPWNDNGTQKTNYEIEVDNAGTIYPVVEDKA